MTKKEKILDSALRLFSTEGVNAVSTARIAKRAEVSEGLIFRHFANKQGLLNAIILQLEEKISELAAPVMEEQNPGGIIKSTITGLLKIEEKDYDFWKLQYKLKTDDNYDTQHLMQPYINHLTNAFAALDYDHPQLEAQLFCEVIDGTMKQLVTGKLDNKKEFVHFLLGKYGV